MPKTVIFGAGNVGRALHGPTFSIRLKDNLYSAENVTFVDIDEKRVKLLNDRGWYPVEICGEKPGRIKVKNVRALLNDGRHKYSVLQAVRDADIVVTSVGKNNLKDIYQFFAEALSVGKKPLSVIVAENMMNAEPVFREGVSNLIILSEGKDEITRGSLYLTGACIGTMTPLPSQPGLVERMLKKDDPLLVRREEYDKIIISKDGFPEGYVPRDVYSIENLKVVNNLKPYMEQKLLVHNGGHSAAAWYGSLEGFVTYISEAVNYHHIREDVEKLMHLAGNALLKEYPDVFSKIEMDGYINDLLSRFNNGKLKDTVFRVGQDLPRKLAPDDRLVPTLRLAQKYDMDYKPALKAIAAALLFRESDEHGKLSPNDLEVVKELGEDGRGIDYALQEFCKFDPARDSKIIQGVKEFYSYFQKEKMRRIDALSPIIRQMDRSPL